MKQEIIGTLLFLENKDQILLAMKKRGFGEGRFNGAGGKPEAGETIEETLVCETREEIGVEIKTWDKVAEITFDEYFKGKPAIVTVHVYISDNWEGEPVETEEMAPKWFKKNNLPYETMWPDDIHWLPMVLAGKKVKAHFELDENDVILSHNIKTVKQFMNPS